MKKLLKGALTGALLVTLATPGFAENRKGSVNLSPFVGGYLLDQDQREENRPIFGLRAGYNFTKNFAFEGMFGYSLTETKRGFNGSRETDLYRYGGDFLFHFNPDGKFVPFIAVGGGGTSFNIPDTPSLQNHSAYLADYGGGFKYFVAPDVALRADVRHAILIHDAGDNNLEYSAGLTFQFGGVRKAAAAIAVIAPDEDTTIPTVIFTAPVNGASLVYVNQKANVAFSEDMDTTTINSESFSMKQGSTPVPGSVSATGSTATFAPANNYENGKVYTATVTTGAKDLAGNRLANNYMWEFNAGQAADTTAPTVTLTTPVRGDKTTPVNQNVSAAFSENMDPATINSSTFSVKQGATPVAGRVTSSASTATFTPAHNLEKGKAYTATVTTGTKDLSGNALASNYVWDFKAYQAPKVIGVLATLENSHFDFNSAAISENGKTILDLNAKTLKKNPNMKIRIAGHTSAAGSNEYNQDLSERRASSVKDFLVNKGIAGSRIETIGYGETRPAKHEADPADKLSAEAYANMRVVIEITEE